MHKILVVIGSRSEAIRAAPLISRLRAVPSILTIVCIAARQDLRLAGELADFGLLADEELLPGEHANLSHAVDHVIAKHKPDCVLVYGDPDKSMASFSRSAALGDAGTALHMYELHHHKPDGGGTHLIDLAATRYFVSSERSRDNLLEEGVASENLFITDSTEVDAVLMVAERISQDGKLKAKLAAEFPFIDATKRLIYVTGDHCNDDEFCQKELCHGLKQLAMRPDVQVVFSMPSDPVKSGCVARVFADQPGITLIPPQDYLHSVYLMQAACLILSDPADMLKGAFSLNKPVLAMGGMSGSRTTAGGETGGMLQECSLLLDDSLHYQSCSMRRNPYGDGHASQRIVETLLR